MKKRILRKERVKVLEPGFSYIPHKFYTAGYLKTLSQSELLFYLFLIIVGDKYGLSYYKSDSISSILDFYSEEFLTAHDGLIKKDLIAYSDGVYQVLSLPRKEEQAC